MTEESHSPHERLDTTSVYGVLQSTLSEQQRASGTRYVVFADINKTTELPGVNNTGLYETLTLHKLGFVNITSLSLKEVVGLIQTGVIQPPHAVSTKNGTIAYGLRETSIGKPAEQITEDDFILDEEYKKMVEQSGFNKTDLLQDARMVFIPHLQEKFPGITIDFQTEDRGENWKTWGLKEDPYQLVFDIQTQQAKEAEDIHALATNYYPNKSIFLIHNGKNGNHKYGLHILPSGIAKNTPIKHIYDQVQATGGIFAGDSENDAVALFGDYGEFGERLLRVVVGGASSKLLGRLEDMVRHPRQGSWQRLTTNALLYQERSDKLGPASLTHAIQQAIQLAKRSRQ